MPKDYNKLWVFGDSYTAPNHCVDTRNSFWGLAAVELGAKEIVNCSWTGNSFASVWHMLVGMQSQFDFENDYFIVGIPPLERLTVFDNFKDTRYNATYIDPTSWQQNQEEIQCHTGLQVIQGQEAQKMVIYEDRSWTETQAQSQLFLLTTWLDSVSADYLVVNLSKPFDSNCRWAPNTFVLPYCESHPRCILFNDTYYSVNVDKHHPVDFGQYGWMGHHGPAGNKHFFETSIKPKLATL